MSKCKFIFHIDGDPYKVYQKAEQAILRAGGSLSGNTYSGSFSVPTPLGTVRGEYSTSGGKVTIIIQEKPWLISCNQIRGVLENELN